MAKQAKITEAQAREAYEVYGGYRPAARALVTTIGTIRYTLGVDRANILKYAQKRALSGQTAAYARQRKATETPVQREKRLAAMRAAGRAHYARNKAAVLARCLLSRKEASILEKELRREVYRRWCTTPEVRDRRNAADRARRAAKTRTPLERQQNAARNRRWRAAKKAQRAA